MKQLREEGGPLADGRLEAFFNFGNSAILTVQALKETITSHWTGLIEETRDQICAMMFFLCMLVAICACKPVRTLVADA